MQKELLIPIEDFSDYNDARVIMEYDGQEIEQISKYIKEVFKEEKEN